MQTGAMMTRGGAIGFDDDERVDIIVRMHLIGWQHLAHEHDHARPGIVRHDR
jgi:hypothetical protein